MNLNYDFTEEELSNIKSLYEQKFSCPEIKEMLKLPHTVRAIQRRVRRMGIIRTVAEAVKLAREKGRYSQTCKCPKCGYIFKK